MTRPTLEELARRHARKRLPQKKRNAELRAHGYDPDGADGAAYRKLLFAPPVRPVPPVPTLGPGETHADAARRVLGGRQRPEENGQ